VDGRGRGKEVEGVRGGRRGEGGKGFE